MKSKLKYSIFEAAVYMVDLHRGQGGEILEGIFDLAPFKPLTNLKRFQFRFETLSVSDLVFEDGAKFKTLSWIFPPLCIHIVYHYEYGKTIENLFAFARIFEYLTSFIYIM